MMWSIPSSNNFVVERNPNYSTENFLKNEKKGNSGNSIEIDVSTVLGLFPYETLLLPINVFFEGAYATTYTDSTFPQRNISQCEHIRVIISLQNCVQIKLLRINSWHISSSIVGGELSSKKIKRRKSTRRTSIIN